VLPRDGRPILVYCEHGVRSRHAADLLVRAGFENVHNLALGMAEWHGPREMGEGRLWGPSPWVLEHAPLYASKRRVLDVASGRGRHALLFAAAGFDVTAMDRNAEALDELRASAAALGVSVDTRPVDMEASDYSFGPETWDVVVVTRYLHRPLFPALRAAVAPDGLLVYETFTAAQRDEPTGPSRPEFLLEPGELRALVAPLEIVAYDEDVVDAQHLARVVARKP
jgi:SAM-dependent methyltransferase